MNRLRVFLAAILLAAPSASCAYYNGLYNANAFARHAERAEREGRTLDAENDWAQVTAKAETVLVRHPKSRWADEARYLSGKSRERVGDCQGAVPLLQQVVREGRDPQRADDAALRLAACEVRLGDLQAAGFAVERLIDSPDPVRRAEARWRAGIAYRRSGQTAEAVTLLRTSDHPQARGELAAALADAGRSREAIALSDSLLQGPPDSLVPWGAVLTGVGQRDPAAASALLDRILAKWSPSPDSGSAWLSADAERLLPVDESRGLARFEAAYQRATARAVGVDARILALRHRLARTDDPALLDTVPALLGDVEPSAGEALMRARQLVASAASIRGRLDSLVVDAPQGDLQGFLLGEALRDSLHAPRLAARVWRQVLEGRADSPYAPKLLLAIGGTGTTPGDSILALLAEKYAASPYVLALQGRDDPGFRTLEDSLAHFAEGRRAAARAPARAPVRARPASPAPATPVQ